jgi:dimethylargininase
MFNHAIVRRPCSSYPQGITSANLGRPSLKVAVKQHAAYCAALEKCGLNLIVLEPDHQYPDSTFVEDTAVLTGHSGIITRPGATTRRDEVVSMKPVISQYFEHLDTIQPPGKLDGGDICQAGNHFFIGISERTNADGAQQLASILVRDGYSSSFINLRGFDGLLHLKSGIAHLGDRRLVLVRGMDQLAKFDDFEIINVDQEESYAANCVRVNEYVLVADGFPKFAATLTGLGYRVLSLKVSEFQKMDGGLSCLSLRF